MEIIILPDAAAVCRLGARIMARTVRDKPNAVLGLATGGTPVPLYAELVRMHREEHLDLSHIVTFNLDEYVGLSPSHPASYHHYMHTNLFAHVNTPPTHVNIPDGQASDVPAACAHYERKIWEAGGIDLQLLGLGEDGHIGFNEPTSSLGSRTRIKTLAASTMIVNREAFGDQPIPRHVITMGVQTILEARRILMLACGEKKAAAVAGMVEGPITAMLPASVLQMHPTTVVLLDEAAASRLSMRDYFKSVYENKPEWQRYE
jgi:glucosamine-6-phosphate deaminase